MGIDVDVLMPKDDVLDIMLERWSPEYKRWYLSPKRRERVVRGPGSFAFEPMQAGRWRVVDAKSGKTSAAVEVNAKALRARVTLDLSRAGIVRGRVDAPDGIELSRASIRVISGDIPRSLESHPAAMRHDEEHAQASGRPASTPEHRGPTHKTGPYAVDSDGFFYFRVSGTPTVIEAVHPDCSSVEQVEVTSPRSNVVLKLVPSSPIRIPLSIDESLGASLASQKLDVFFVDSVSQRLERRESVLEEETLRVIPPNNGVFDIWVVPGTLAPVCIKAVDVERADDVIDRVSLNKGSTIQVKFEGGEPPKIFRIRAEYLGTVRYLRSQIVRPNQAASVSGLGAGRHRIMVRGVMGSATILYDEEHDIDGETNVDIVVPHK